MTDEDRTAAKLKGYTCILKFKDGEELLLAVDFVNEAEWFIQVEGFIQGTGGYLPIPDIAVARDAIKYIKKI